MKEETKKAKPRSAFVDRNSNEGWPEWSRYVVGVAGGFHVFEDEKEGEAFLSAYFEDQKKSA